MNYIFIISYSIALILIYKIILFKNKLKNMQKIEAICTDKTIRTTYQKNIRLYFYTYKYKNEVYNISDKTKYKILGFDPQIKEKFCIYSATQNPNKCVSQLELFKINLYIILSIALIIIPILIYYI